MIKKSEIKKIKRKMTNKSGSRQYGVLSKLRCISPTRQKMIKLINVILLIACTTMSFASNNNYTNDKLRIEINRNVELLGLAYFLGFEGVDIESKTVEIGGKKIPKKDWHNYAFYFYQKYKSFATSENLGKALTVADHLWLDYIISLLLQVENFPNAKLKESIDQSYYINFSKTKDPGEATRNVTVFLNGLNEFYKEINFENYFIETKAFYEKVINEVRSGLPKQDLIGAMEDFYKNKFDGYVLIPSLTIPKGMGFGLRNTAGKKTRVFNVFGAFDAQEFLNTKDLKMGFTNQIRLRELSVHDFGPSFLNLTVDKLPDDIFSQTEKLVEPLKAAMSDQGYITWRICIYEHFVRAGEIMIAEKLGNKDGDMRLQT